MATSLAGTFEPKAQQTAGAAVSPVATQRAATLDESALSEVVAAASSGDNAAWVHLTDRFGNLITAIARSCRLGDADVGEVVQTTWFRLVENIDRIQQPERIGAWLATTARRESLRLVRVRGRVVLDSEVIELQPDHGPLHDANLLAEERSQAVRLAYAKLPPRCQRLLSLLSGDDPPSYKELSALLDMPIGSIGPTRGRCLEHLRRILMEASPDL
jgi:RNA polymerase sigma factor (sigma-70 family)